MPCAGSRLTVLGLGLGLGLGLKLGLGLGLAVLGLACRGPSLPPGFTEADALAFQRAHDQALGEPVSPLTAVASHYVDPGQTLVLTVEGDAVTTELGSSDEVPRGPLALAPSARLRLEVTDQGARCVEGCGPAPEALEGPREVSLDRFTVLLSPQSGTTRVLIHDPRAPARTAYAGLRWFPVRADVIVPARFRPDPERPTVELSTSRGLLKPFVRAGVLEAELLGQPVALTGYQAGDERTLLVPFTDRTTGHATYPVGRYLEVQLPESGSVALDLNRATNPWCAYSEHYNCPIPPADNALPVAVEAGEQTYEAH